MGVEMLRTRAMLEKNFYQLVKAIKRRKKKWKRGKNIDILENQFRIVSQRLQEIGGFLTAEEKKRIKKAENYDYVDYKENLLLFEEEKMKEKKGQEISTDFYCRNCGNKISGQPYIRNGECYCHLCRPKAKLGFFDNIIPQHYNGTRVNG